MLRCALVTGLGTRKCASGSHRWQACTLALDHGTSRPGDEAKRAHRFCRSVYTYAATARTCAAVRSGPSDGMPLTFGQWH